METRLPHTSISTAQNQHHPEFVGVTTEQCKRAFYLGLPATSQIAPTNRLNFSKLYELRAIGLDASHKDKYVGGVIGQKFKSNYRPRLIELHNHILIAYAHLCHKEPDLTKDMKVYMEERAQRIYCKILEGHATEAYSEAEQLIQLAIRCMPRRFMSELQSPNTFVKQTLPFLGMMLITLE